MTKTKRPKRDLCKFYVSEKTNAGLYHVYFYKENKLEFQWYTTRKSETTKKKVFDRVSHLLLDPKYWPKTPIKRLK